MDKRRAYSVLRKSLLFLLCLYFINKGFSQSIPLNKHNLTKEDSITSILIDKFAADSIKFLKIEGNKDGEKVKIICLKAYFPQTRVDYVLDQEYISLIAWEYFKLTGPWYNIGYDYLEIASTTIFSKNELFFDLNLYDKVEVSIKKADELFSILTKKEYGKMEDYFSLTYITIKEIQWLKRHFWKIDSVHGPIKYFDLTGMNLVSEDTLLSNFTDLRYKVVFDDNSMTKFILHVRRNDLKIQHINISEIKDANAGNLQKPIREAYLTKHNGETIKVLPDPNFLGTEEDLRNEIEQGNLEMYYVKSEEGNFLIERIRKKENKDNFPITLWTIVILLIPIIWYVTKTKNNERITKYFNDRGFEIIYEDWDPFAGDSWFGERNIANYRVLYYDNDRKVHEAVVRTGFFYGVEVTEDKLIDITSDTEKTVKLSAIQSKEERINQLKNEIEALKEDIQSEEVEEIQEHKVYKKETYKCEEGELVIEQELFKPNVGENIFLNGIIAPDGAYKIGFLSYVMVEDGKIVKLSTTKDI